MNDEFRGIPIVSVPFSNEEDQGYMNIEVISLKAIVLIIIFEILFVFSFIFISNFWPKRISIQKETIFTSRIYRETDKSFILYLLNQNYFNDFYTVSFNAISNKNLSFTAAVELVGKTKSRLVGEKQFKEIKTKRFNETSERNEWNLLHSAFIDGTQSIRFNITFDDVLEPVEMNLFAETSTSSSLKLHTFIKFIITIFMVFVYISYSRILSASGFVCPEQFATHFYTILYCCFNAPINIFRPFFPLSMMRTLDSILSVLMTCLLLITELVLLYDRIYVDDSTKSKIRMICLVPICLYGIISIFNNVMLYVFLKQPTRESNISFYLLIFAIYALFFASYECYKHKDEGFSIQNVAYCLITIATNILLIASQFFYMLERHYTDLDISFHMNQAIMTIFVFILCFIHYPLRVRSNSRHKKPKIINTRDSPLKQI